MPKKTATAKKKTVKPGKMSKPQKTKKVEKRGR